MATGCSSSATGTRRTSAARNWALDAVSAWAAVVVDASVVDGAAVVEVTLVAGPAPWSGSSPEQPATARARARSAAGPRRVGRMPDIVVGYDEVCSPAVRCRSHSDAVAGCIVRSTTASSSPCRASRSTWSRSRAANPSTVRAAS